MKKRFVLFLTMAITALYICFIVMDFSRLISLDLFAYMMPSAILKRICVILAASIVWIAGRDRLDSTDNRLMKAAFIIICFAEAALFYGKMALGISFFIACQILLCYRNGKGLTDGMRTAGKARRFKLVIFGLLLFSAFLVTITLSYRIILRYNLLLVVCTYAILISSSLWVGLANHTLGLMPRENSIMIAAGMFCFYCCDILVGLDEIMEPGLAWVLANSGIWFFYVPAITLLALSCYRYDNSK